ncbi:MAG TPA: hypothetical protein VHF25_08070 [Nitriliruptorales bacterium]|nr:hypothetical protein [Nitriliruptorales bacterium]
MKQFKTLVVLRQPLQPVWSTMQDRLPELIPMIDDVASVTVLEREEVGPGRTRLVNEWRARQRLPAVVRDAVQGEVLGWIDHNLWDDQARVCVWNIEPFVLPESIRCQGTTTYEPAMGGRGCRVTFEGTFELADGALSGLAGALQRPVASFVESIVSTYIPRNTRAVLEAAARLCGAGRS